MKNLSVLLPAAFLLCVSLAALAQKNMSPPVASMDPETKTGPNEPAMPKRIDLVEVQREADVLAAPHKPFPPPWPASAKACCRTMSSRN